MVDHVKLRTLIDTDPAAPHASDAAALAYLDGTVTVHGTVDSNDIAIWAAEQVTARKLRRAILDQEIAENFNNTPWLHYDPSYSGASTDLPGEGTAPAALALPYTNGVYNDTLVMNYLVEGRAESVALDRADIRAIVNNISGSGKPLSAANKTDLLARGDTTEDRWRAGRADDGPRQDGAGNPGDGFPEMSDASKLYHIGEARALP